MNTRIRRLVIITVSIIFVLSGFQQSVLNVCAAEGEKSVIAVASDLTVEKAAETVSNEESDVIVIGEEETPLAVRNCKAHWAVLTLTALYTCYGIIRTNSRGKQIRKLKMEREGSTAEA